MKTEIERNHQNIMLTFNDAVRYATGFKLKKKFNLLGDKFLLSIFLLILISGGISFLWEVFLYGQIIGLFILVLSIVYRIIFYKVFNIINFGEKYSILLNEINTIHQYIYNNIDNKLSMDDILKQLGSIQKLIKKIQIYKYIWKYTISDTGIFFMKKYIKLEVLFIIQALTDLRSDLSIRITEQQQTLKSAKSEVESNIKGTTELDQVSELQRIRLDKQIEQFEELQRALVKV